MGNENMEHKLKGKCITKELSLNESNHWQGFPQYNETLNGKIITIKLSESRGVQSLSHALFFLEASPLAEVGVDLAEERESRPRKMAKTASPKKG